MRRGPGPGLANKTRGHRPRPRPADTSWDGPIIKTLPFKSKSTWKTYPVFWFSTLGAVAMKRGEWGVSRSPGGCEGIYPFWWPRGRGQRQVGLAAPLVLT